MKELNSGVSCQTLLGACFMGNFRVDFRWTLHCEDSIIDRKRNDHGIQFVLNNVPSVSVNHEVEDVVPTVE